MAQFPVRNPHPQGCDKGKCSSQLAGHLWSLCSQWLCGDSSAFPWPSRSAALGWGVQSPYTLWLPGHSGYILAFTCLRSSSLVLCMHLTHSVGTCLAWSLGSSANIPSRFHTSSRTYSSNVHLEVTHIAYPCSHSHQQPLHLDTHIMLSDCHHTHGSQVSAHGRPFTRDSNAHSLISMTRWYHILLVPLTTSQGFSQPSHKPRLTV